MLNNQIENSLSQRFSLYALPLIGAMGVLLFSLSLKFLRLNSVLEWDAWNIDLSALSILLFEQFARAGAKFTLILLLAYRFRATIFTFKNSLAVFFAVIMIEIVTLFFVQLIFGMLNDSGYYLVYYFLGNSIGALINLVVYLVGIWLLFGASGNFLDRFTGTVHKTTGYWVIANFISLFFVIVAIYYLLLDLYFSTGYSVFEVKGDIIIYLGTFTAFVVLALLVILKKVQAQSLGAVRILIVGIYLGFVMSTFFMILDWCVKQIDQVYPQAQFSFSTFIVLTVYLLVIVGVIYFTVKKRFS